MTDAEAWFRDMAARSMTVEKILNRKLRNYPTLDKVPCIPPELDEFSYHVAVDGDRKDYLLAMRNLIGAASGNGDFDVIVRGRFKHQNLDIVVASRSELSASQQPADSFLDQADEGSV